MVLVDTSVWIAHLRTGEPRLAELLDGDGVCCHPFVIGELACGNIANRGEVLSLLQSLPMAVSVEHDELLRFISYHCLMGKGMGYIDMHLLSSAALTGAPLWTTDRRLGNVAVGFGVGY